MNKQKLLYILFITISLIVLIASITINILIKDEKPQEELYKNRSIYNKNKSGYAAWYKVLTKSNIKPIIWRKDFDKLATIKEQNATMIIISPGKIAEQNGLFNQTDTKALLNWILKGNTLVFISDFADSNSKSFLKKLMLKYTISKKNQDDQSNTDYYGKKTVYPLLKYKRLNFKAKEISSNSTVSLKKKYLKPLITFNKRIVLAKRQYGRGEIYILTLPDIADNQSLYEEENNYQFLVNLISKDKKTIYINEYVHGNIKNENILSYYSNTLMNPISKQLFFIFILFVVGIATRFGEPRKLKTTARTTNIEYVSSLALLYRKAKLTGIALKSIYHKFKVSLCKKYKLNPNITDQELIDFLSIQSSDQETKDLITLIQDTTNAIKYNNINKKEMLKIVQRLNKYRLKGK